VLNGHMHQYERLAPQTPQGAVDPAYGIRQFVVGTGGKSLQAVSTTPLPTSEAASASTFGVLLMTLHPDSYDWKFVPINRRGFTDSGSTACHGAPPGRPAAATTGDAGPVNSTAERVSGAVDPGNQPTSFHFEYGRTAAYGLRTAEVPVSGPADGAREVSARLGRLKKKALYHYRVVATNAGGTAVGGDRLFRVGARTPYPAAIARTKGLLAYWRLDGGSLAYDLAGQNLGTDWGPVATTQGALKADRSTASGFAGSPATLEAFGPVLTTSATIEGWFRWTAGDYLLRDDSSAGGWLIGRSASKLGFRVAGRAYRSGLSIDRVRDGAWHYLAVTKSGPAVAMYVDGRRMYAAGGAANTPPTMPWHVMRNGPFDEFSQGQADELAMYDRRLSSATIKAHFQAGVARHPTVTTVRGPEGPTNKSNPVFRFLGGPSVRCSFAGPGVTRALGACPTLSGFGHLADGSYSVTAYAIDASGHPDPTPVTRRFTVDTVPPALTVVPPARVPSGLRKRGLAVQVTCSEACAVTARMSVAAGDASRLHLAKGRRAMIGSATLPTGRAGTRSLRVGVTARVRKRLKGRRPPAVTLNVVATDRAGNRSAQRLELAGP
jgi:Concanavalin A-like lectin/glucanases superfamily